MTFEALLHLALSSPSLVLTLFLLHSLVLARWLSFPLPGELVALSLVQMLSSLPGSLLVTIQANETTRSEDRHL